jgi:hypothetical protein
MSTIPAGVVIKGPDGATYTTGQRGRVPAWVESSLKYRVLVAKSEYPDSKVIVDKANDRLYVIGQRGRVPEWVLSHPDYVSTKSTEVADTNVAKNEPTPVVESKPVVLTGPEGATYTLGNRGRPPAWVVEHPEYIKYKSGKTEPVKTDEPTTVRAAVTEDGRTYTFKDVPATADDVIVSENGELDIDANTLTLYATRVDEAIKVYKEKAPDYFAKKELHIKAKTFLKLFARKMMKLDDDKYDVRSNPAGDAVCGEITLHTDSLYVQVGAESHLPVLFRKCHGRTDYTGESNNWADSVKTFVDIFNRGL